MTQKLFAERFKQAINSSDLTLDNEIARKYRRGTGFEEIMTGVKVKVEKRFYGPDGDFYIVSLLADPKAMFVMEKEDFESCNGA